MRNFEKIRGTGLDGRTDGVQHLKRPPARREDHIISFFIL